VPLKQLARKLTLHVSLQGMSSAGQKRSPPNELERQVSADKAAAEYVYFAAFCHWPCAESVVKLKTNSQPWLAGLAFPGRGGQAAESNTVCQHLGSCQRTPLAPLQLKANRQLLPLASPIIRSRPLLLQGFSRQSSCQLGDPFLSIIHQAATTPLLLTWATAP